MLAMTQELACQILRVVDETIPNGDAAFNPLKAEIASIKAKRALYQRMFANLINGQPLEEDESAELEGIGDLHVVDPRELPVILEGFELLFDRQIGDINRGPWTVANIRSAYVSDLRHTLEKIVGTEFDADGAQALIDNLVGFVIQVMAPTRDMPHRCIRTAEMYDLFGDSNRREIARLAAHVREKLEELITCP